MGWDGWDFETMAVIAIEARSQHLIEMRTQVLGMAAAVQSVFDRKALDAFLKILDTKTEETKPTPKPEKVKGMVRELNKLTSLLNS